MQLVHILLAGLLVTVVPICLGRIFSERIRKEYAGSVAFWLIYGFIAMLGIFQLLTVPFTLLEIPFHCLVYLYSFLLLGLVLYAFARYGSSILKEMACMVSAKKWLNIVFVFALAVIAVQMVISMMSVNYGADDDAAYIAYANDTIQLDAIFSHSPYTGEYTGVGVNKMTLTSWCVFIAYLGKVSRIPVTVVAHTVLPVVLIGYAYTVYYLMAKVLMKDNYTKIGWFLTVLSFLHIGGDSSVYTITFRLLQVQWQGKAVAAAIVTPFLLYYIYVMHEEKTMKQEYINLALAMVAAAGCSLVGAGLAFLVVVAGSPVMADAGYRLKSWISVFICSIPCAAYCIAFLLQYTLTAWLRG